MSWMLHDPDEWETISSYTPCSCGGLANCNGCCNGSAGVGTRRRAPEDIARIKAEKRRQHEESVLAEAAQIMARRAEEARTE